MFHGISASVAVQAGLCQTWSETTLLVFPRGDSNLCIMNGRVCTLVHFQSRRKSLYNCMGVFAQYPLEPHFYIEKLGFAGVYLFFLFLLQNIDCGYLLEPPRRGGSNMYPQSMF